MTYNRMIFNKILSRLQSPRQFIQVLLGPRQVGKTTLALQILAAYQQPKHYASADEATANSEIWLEQQWQIARLQITREGAQSGLLILDEVQRLPLWSTVVKRLWDEDARQNCSLHVLLLGSAPLLLQQGITESLAGRIEVIPVTHWSFTEMRDAFDFSLEQFIYFGGYPGAAGLINDEERWSNYIRDSLIETTISRDILLMTRVDKPALFRRLFDLSCHYSGQILSYQKMLGQLQEAGNATTLAHYLKLLSGASMVTGLEKYAGQPVRQRASSPKLQVLNTALLSALAHQNFIKTRQDPAVWGRWVEAAAGAHLLNSSKAKAINIFYWRERQYEVDFVLQKNEALLGLEIKSTLTKSALPGMAQFAKAFHPTRCLQIGGQGMPLIDFFSHSADTLFS